MRHRLQALDVLRTLAVFGVLGVHAVLLGAPASSNPLVKLWARVGWTGVDLFFVLSGFLVSGLLFDAARAGQIDFWRFFLRRGLKIWPAFYVYTAFVMAMLAFQGEPVDFGTATGELLFVQNYHGFIWTAHTWSLAVEEHFYLLLPLLLIGLLRLHGSFRRLPAFVIGIAVLALVARVWNAYAAPFTSETHIFPTHLRIDALMLGVGLRYWHDRQPAAFTRAAHQHWFALLTIAPAVLVPVVWLGGEHRFVHTVGLTGLSAGAAALIVVAVGRGVGTHPLVRLIAWIGRHSYSIYLWHVAVLIWVMPGLVRPLRLWTFPRFMLVYTCLAITTGILLARAVEWPILKIRDRWLPHQQPVRTERIASAGVAVS